MRPDRLPEPNRDAEVRRRQKGRAMLMAWLLGAFVVLIFAIAIVKIGAAMHHPR